MIYYPLVSTRSADVRSGSRRAFLAGTGAIAVGVALDAFLVEPRWLDVSSHEVTIPGLPRDLEGFAVAQVTDAHLTQIGAVEEAIYRTLQKNDIQLVVLSGDMIDSVLRLESLKRFCSGLRKKGTVIVASLGNWEHWGQVPVADLADAYSDLGIKLLVNDGIGLAEGLRVFATDDATGGTPRIRKLYDDRASAMLLVTHSPAFLDSTSLLPGAFSLALAGHTHGGQLRLGPGAVPFLPQGCGRFLAGWYDTRGGRAYVSRGTGSSILPARFTCRPELPIFRLRQG